LFVLGKDQRTISERFDFAKPLEKRLRSVCIKVANTRFENDKGGEIVVWRKVGNRHDKPLLWKRNTGNDFAPTSAQARTPQ
jgi:hypothetical protein